MQNRLGFVVRSGHGATLTHLRSTRARIFALGIVAVLVAAGLAWALWPAEEPRSRQYRDVVACLLTDDKGLNSPDAATVWSGMQDASLETLARVQYLEVTGDQTAENAAAFVMSQVQSRCSMVLAVGGAQAQAVQQVASRHPGVRFVAFDKAVTSTDENMSVLELSRAAVRAVVIEVTASDQPK